MVVDSLKHGTVRKSEGFGECDRNVDGLNCDVMDDGDCYCAAFFEWFFVFMPGSKGEGFSSGLNNVHCYIDIYLYIPQDFESS